MFLFYKNYFISHNTKAKLITEADSGLIRNRRQKMGMILKIETRTIEQGLFNSYMAYTTAQKFFKYAPVAVKDLVDMTNERIGGNLPLVVVIITALIVAEFFICPST